MTIELITPFSKCKVEKDVKHGKNHVPNILLCIFLESKNI